MPTTVKASTELDAVNVILSTLGLPPLNALPDSGNAVTEMARSLLKETLREVLTKSWHFNTEDDYPLTPDTNGFITLGADVHRVDLNKVNDSTYNVVLRGQALYNKAQRSSIFTGALRGSVVFFLAFEEIPEAARYYITVKAARRFVSRSVGSQALWQFTAEDERDALSVLKETESEDADYSIFDNYDAAAPLMRGMTDDLF